ncbi:MAG: 3-methyl-2-oxobutanoate dehydrogenase [Myxococcales bacterium]|nr:3-methyl-2-oxobutanoate dehydrogenase [Myxococcales bacterium]
MTLDTGHSGSSASLPWGAPRVASDADPHDVGLLRVLDDEARAAAGAPTIPSDILLRGYREMRRLRAIDARMIVLQRQGRVGFYGACTGQEAVPIATGLALEANDWVFPALREQSVMLVRGFPLRAFIAQVFGNSGDVLKGRQMPSHHSGRAVHQVSWSSNIGPQIPQAVGAAWAMKRRRAEDGPRIAVGFSGDGATSQPDFHYALNFAVRYDVPAVLVTQNNHWSISVPTSKQTASRTLAIKGRAYRIPTARVDGNDLLAVYLVLKAAFERARRGEGPSFVECVTYRMGAHSTSDDPTRYRSNEEVEHWRRKDPVDRLRKHLAGLGLVTDASDAALDLEFASEIGAAIKDVEALPPPDRATLFDDVYATLPWHLEEQRAALAKLPPAPTHG